MEGVWPQSSSADLETNPATRPRLQMDHPAQDDMEGPMETSSDQLTSVVFLPSGSALQLTLDDCDLLLEPQPTSILEVALPGHSILLVPEGLQDSTSSGHPEFLPSDPLDSALLDMPRELIVIQPGSFSDSGQVPDGRIPSVSPGAEGYAPWAYWSPQGNMLEFLPHSPLEPPPPSSPSSHQEQCPLSPVRPTRPPCKAKRRLLF